jgi:hypothetical protein
MMPKEVGGPDRLVLLSLIVVQMHGRKGTRSSARQLNLYDTDGEVNSRQSRLCQTQCKGLEQIVAVIGKWYIW